MPENEFEKKVSSEMQELKFKPSEKVWLQVEERIRRKKKRRVFILMFLLAGLGLLGYWQWNNLFTSQENEVVKIAKAVDQKTGSGNDPLLKKENENNNLQNTQTTNTNIPSSTRGNAGAIDKNSFVADESRPQKERIVSVNTNNPVRKKKKSGAEITTSTEENIIAEGDTVKDRNEPRGKEDPLKEKYPEPNYPDTDPDKNEMKPGEKRPDSTNINTAIVGGISKKDSVVKSPDSVSKTVVPIDSPVVKLPVKAVNKKWKFGIELTPGFSSLNESVFQIDMSKSADAYANPSTGSGIPPVPTTGPSANSAGFGFQTGVVARKQVTARSSLSIGLRYGYYSDKITIGRDTLISYTSPQSALNSRAFYSASNSFRDKTNSYHFIELPVNFQLRLNKKEDKPFTWDAGFAIGRFIATNALMYDSAYGGVYYTNQEWVNKIQFSLSTGFSLTLIGNKTIQWSAGPVIDFHLNSLVDNPFEDKKYLLFTGLRSRILFNSKK